MLKTVDDVPNAPVLRWISWIRLFDFETKHVPAPQFKLEDGLSRRKPSPTDQPYDDHDPEEFLDAYNDLVYGSRTHSLAVATTNIQSAKFLFNQLYIHYSNPHVQSWNGRASQVPLLHDSEISLDLPDFSTSLPSLPVYPCDEYSVLAATASRSTDSNPPRRLPEFYYRSLPVKCSLEFLFGGELITLEFTAHIGSSQSPPLSPEHLSQTGHRNGIKDQDGVSYWKELRIFLKTGQYPGHLVTEKDMLRFRKRSQRFFLQEDHLWLAPKTKPDRLPRLVIIDPEKRQYLIARAHNECGHRGRDATYRHLCDRFYWPNLYDEVTYFVRSCIECQKSVKSTPILPYNESWQAPLLRHFNLDSIKMPKGVGGYDYIIQAVEPTILWPEARAVSGNGAAAVAKFIYEDIICRFGCVPYFTFDGGPEFKKEVTDLLETQYRCTVIFSTPYHPQGNAPVERAHQPLVDSLFKCTGDAKGTWPRYIHAVLFAMRVTVSRATGFSPYYLLYGAHPVFSFDLTEVTWQTLNWHTV